MDQAMVLGLKGKINKKIMNMDIEDVNRNTRSSKDFLKDELKNQKLKEKLK